jgi:4-amino-4-deoxy-L-arabinose transferase-like glycosyltransferase
MKIFEKRDLFILIPIGILLLIQIPNLSLPYFWDEAWSYFTSIKKMAEAGPSLLPGAVPLDYCKGHPQFYFFITSLWMKIFPDSIIMMRIFSLSISVILLLIIFYGLKRIVSRDAGMIAALLISVQSLFLAQSIFLLPEMLVALFFILSFFFYYKEEYWKYAVVSTLMVLTKETTIIFCIVFGVYYLASFTNKLNRLKFKPINILFLFVPAIVYALFLFLHYLKFGMFFYGEHLNYITFDAFMIKTNINQALSSIFLKQGRIYLSAVFLISLLIFIILKRGILKFITIGFVSIISFLLFSVFNFYTIRYGLVLMILTIILFSYVLNNIYLKDTIKYFLTISLAIGCLFFSFTKKTNSDSDLGYVETIKVHQDLVKYCEDKNFYNDTLAVSFNMIFNLKDKGLGYVRGNENFTNVYDWKNVKESQVFIYESTFNENDESVVYAKNNFTLIKSFTNGHAWGHIYKRTVNNN